MQLIILILAVFGLGYWFARSNSQQRLENAIKNTRKRLSQKPVRNANEPTELEDETDQ